MVHIPHGGPTEANQPLSLKKHTFAGARRGNLVITTCDMNHMNLSLPDFFNSLSGIACDYWGPLIRIVLPGANPGGRLHVSLAIAPVKLRLRLGCCSLMFFDVVSGNVVAIFLILSEDMTCFLIPVICSFFNSTIQLLAIYV